MDVQFDKAEFTSPASSASQCVGCATPITGEYYEVNGQTFCASCTAEARRGLGSWPGPAGFFKALAGGIGGGIVGALVYYAVLLLTGYNLAIIAIVVGFLTGKGVSWGSGGRGGPLYQAMAIVLTYVAIVSCYVPFAFAGEPAAGHEAVTPVVGFIAIVLLIIAFPFLAGFENIIGLFIIGIGLYEAWKINKRVPFAVSGPFHAGPGVPPVPPPAPAMPGP
jgi:hypothetical protein